jgi:lysyl-tRNA synthetase class 1
VTVYAYSRVGYHRSLDLLRRNGWKGHGPVPWEHEPNRGFLGCLALLARSAKVIGETDEWDALTRKAADPAKRDAAVLAWERASATAAAGRLLVPAVVVPFRMLSSVADVTAGSREITARTVGASEADLEPRLGKAATWITDYVDPDDRTTVRESADADRLAALDEDEELWLRQLLDRLPDSFADTDELTTLIYGVPKLGRGLALDDPPTDEVKADQKAFFRLLYELLVAAERGPRLPTLFAALGPGKVRALLTPPG